MPAHCKAESRVSYLSSRTGCGGGGQNAGALQGGAAGGAGGGGRGRGAAADAGLGLRREPLRRRRAALRARPLHPAAGPADTRARMHIYTLACACVRAHARTQTQTHGETVAALPTRMCTAYSRPDSSSSRRNRSDPADTHVHCIHTVARSKKRTQACARTHRHGCFASRLCLGGGLRNSGVNLNPKHRHGGFASRLADACAR